MSSLDSSIEIMVVIAVVLLGLGSTVVYYFARYYFQTHGEDKELAPGTKPVDIEKMDTAKIDDGSSEGELKQKLTESFRQGAPEKEPVPAGVAEPVAKSGPQKPKDLRDALQGTREGLWGRIKTAFVGSSELDEDGVEMLEEILYTSDLGPQTVQQLVSQVSERLSKEQRSDLESLKLALRGEMTGIFENVKDQSFAGWPQWSQLAPESGGPKVLLVVGVNGAGKTTSIGKMAHQIAEGGKKVLIAAGDTFRAAADSQLRVWSERAGVELFSPDNVTDPSAVAFDACQKGKAGGFDVVIIDTAGRLHTQDNLMEELKKLKRVMAKVLPDAPHETVIVLDANNGQNALVQAKMFNEALGLTGAVLTKLDGTAKGGVAVGLAYELGLAIKSIGVGEGIEDLRPFSSTEFVDSIF